MKIVVTVKTYFVFSLAEFKSKYMAYKTRFLLWVFTNAISVLAQLFLWVAIFNSASTGIINGMTKLQMINYVVVSKIVESMTFASVESQVSNDYADGRIAMSLVKPIQYRSELLFRSFGSVAGSITLFLPIYLVIFIFANINNIFSMSFSMINLICFLFSIIIAFFINYYISIIFSSFIFKTIKSSGLYEVKKSIIKLLSGALFPLAFYPQIISSILKYMPFIYMRFIPVSIIQGAYTYPELVQIIIIGLGWLTVLFTLSRLIWARCLKFVSIYGG